MRVAAAIANQRAIADAKIGDRIDPNAKPRPERNMDRFEKLHLDGNEAFKLGDYRLAAEIFQIVLQQFNCDASTKEYAHRMRGLCYQLQGDYDLALAEFEMSLDANPQSTLAIDRLAYLLATVPDAHLRDGTRAKALAAVTTSRQHDLLWVSLTILAAAESELGEFTEAIKTYERALQIMPESTRRKRLGRLEQLRAGQPLRCSLEFDRDNVFEIKRDPTSE